jgi:hypothetical protein
MRVEPVAEMSNVHLYVALERDEDGYPPFEVEELDATPVSENSYRIDAIPAFAYGLAPGDVVRATHPPDDDRLWVVEVLRASENWVARVMHRSGTEAADVVQRFESLGCRGVRDAVRARGHRCAARGGCVGGSGGAPGRAGPPAVVVLRPRVAPTDGSGKDVR